MEKFEVKITKEAYMDMEKIYDYIAIKLQAPENALGQYNRIADAILTLNANPERFALFDSEPEHSWRIRRMVVDNYLVCYIVDPEVVTVIDVVFGASNVHERLMERHT